MIGPGKSCHRQKSKSSTGVPATVARLLAVGGNWCWRLRKRIPPNRSVKGLISSATVTTAPGEIPAFLGTSWIPTKIRSCCARLATPRWMPIPTPTPWTASEPSRQTMSDGSNRRWLPPCPTSDSRNWRLSLTVMAAGFATPDDERYSVTRRRE